MVSGSWVFLGPQARPPAGDHKSSDPFSFISCHFSSFSMGHESSTLNMVSTVNPTWDSIVRVLFVSQPTNGHVTTPGREPVLHNELLTVYAYHLPYGYALFNKLLVM